MGWSVLSDVKEELLREGKGLWGEWGNRKRQTDRRAGRTAESTYLKVHRRREKSKSGMVGNVARIKV